MTVGTYRKKPVEVEAIQWRMEKQNMWQVNMTSSLKVYKVNSISASLIFFYRLMNLYTLVSI